jgi:hypothetical protein
VAANSSIQIASTDRIQTILNFIVGRFSSANKGESRSAIKKRASSAELKSDVVALPIHKSTE